MDSIVRGAAIYFALLLIFRIAGRRTLSQASPFDFVLLLIISETVQGALIDEDQSFTNSLILVLTLVGLATLLGAAKHRWPAFEKWMDGLPIVVVKEGKIQQTAMDKERIDEADLLVAARENNLAALGEVQYAVAENSGQILVVPKEGKS